MTEERKEQIWEAVLGAASGRDDDPVLVASSLIEAHDIIFKDEVTRHAMATSIKNPFKGKMLLIKVENSLKSMKGLHEISILGIKDACDQTSTPGK